MSIFVLIPIFAAGVNLAIALFVFTRDTHRRVNRVFLLWGLALACWNLGAGMLFGNPTPAAALQWARFTHYGVIFIPVLVLHLSALLTQNSPGRWLLAAYLGAFLFAISNALGWFIEAVHMTGYAWFASITPIYGVFLVYFTLTAYPAFFMVWRAWLSRSRVDGHSLTTLLIADGLLLAMGTHDLLPILGVLHYPGTDFTVYPWGQLAAGIYGLLIGYSVLHDQLLDIRVSLGEQSAFFVRSLFLAAISFCLLVSVVLVFPGYITPFGFALALGASIGSGLMTGVIFPRLLGSGAAALESRILGDRFQYHDQLRAFSSRLLNYQDMNRLLGDFHRQFVDLLSLHSAQVVVINPVTHEPRYYVGVTHHTLKPFTGAAPLSQLFRAGATHLDCRRAPSEYSDMQLVQKARYSLRDLSPEYVFPIARSQLLGFVALGPKTNKDQLTHSDLNLCREATAQLAIAVERLLLTERTALLEKFEFLGMLSAGLAHDLRNRLQPIITFLQLKPFEDLPDPEACKLHNVALQNVESIRAYVHSALFFSDKMKPEFNHVETKDLYAMLPALPSLRPERSKCTVHVTDLARTMIECDCSMIRRALDNLTINALDASSDGQSVDVTITELPSTDSRDRWLRIVVADAGSGIAPENLTRIFDPYFSTKTIGDLNRGVGLGLNITQRLVYLHNGSLSVISSKEDGTKFTLELPIHQSATRS